MAFEQGTSDPIPPPDQPNPVMVGPGISTLGEGAYKMASTVTPAPATDNKQPLQLGDSPSSFSKVPGSDVSTAKSPSTPGEAAGDAHVGADLLHRLSLPVGGKSPMMTVVDPRTAHPGLQLTGRLISAAFCIPYKVAFQPGSGWSLKPRRGTSALFDSFAYLASPEAPWSHTLVGWTGEIESIQGDQRSPPHPVQLDSSRSATAAASNSRAPYLPNNNQTVPPADVDIHRRGPHALLEDIRVSNPDRDRLEAQLRSSEYGRILPVWLTAESDEPGDDMDWHDQGRWRRYAERELYPLLHYKQHGPTDGKKERRWWADYLRLNRLFADRIMQTYQAGDIVLIHDYHLLLLPSLLRQRIPNIYLGFFLHSPFPSSEYLRCLAKRKEILTGTLGANMIGFQAYSYSRHFSSCCTRILGFDSNSAGVDAYGAHAAVDVFPAGIDVKRVMKAAFGTPDIEQTVAKLRKQYAGKKIIVGRDRLDTLHGVAQKLQAFDVFLDRYPQWRGRVVLIQVTSPTSIEEQKEDPESNIGGQISNLVSKINGRYGDLGFSPVQYYPQYLSEQEYFALMRIADVGLITSVRDGVNTTSLEYILCQQGHHGPLILSEFSGTAAMLPSAIHINPWDLGGVAAAVDRSLSMTEEEKAEQHGKLYRHVMSNMVFTWCEQYLHRLLTNLSSFDQSITTPVLDRTKLLKQYRKARTRLFMFDYDGTLTPIVKDPQAAIPSDRVLRTIKTLAADPKNAVWIISGRDQAFLDEWMGHIPELGLSAEHGCFIRKPRLDDWENLAAQTNMGWQNDVMEAFQHYTERTQGSFIERKRVALTWHYRRADPEYGAFQARECRKHIEDTVAKRWDIEVMAGKANLEVRPTFLNKGSIASRLVDEYGTHPKQPPDFILCLGDDFTDEDMFRALRSSNLPPDHVFSVTVGASSKQTLASWHLLEPADVISTIASLNSSNSAEY